MSESGCHSAAWIRGFFISLVVLLSACSDDDKQVTAQQQTNISNQTIPADTIQRREPSGQRPPFSQLVLNKISIDYPFSPNKDFTAFIKRISKQADNKNIKGLQNNLSPQFNCQGLSCQEGSPIAEQFENIVTSLSKQPWKDLTNIIDAKYYQQINGSVCGPANFVFNGDKQDQTTSKGWGYINGKNVRLRKQASTKAAIVTHISHSAAKQVSPNISIKNGLKWVEVQTLKGQHGFVAAKYFLPLKSKQLCYQQISGKWMISGFRASVN
ncbi:MAG TPA: SH3 domain-containing protein [Leucothrix mucor]|nr:SH3 domain-containing protein [Leucothrix mucor]